MAYLDESSLWQELEARRRRVEEKKRRQELTVAYEAAKPFLDYWRLERDRWQRSHGSKGVSVSFPFLHDDGGGACFWSIVVPMSLKLMKEEAQAENFVRDLLSEDEASDARRPWWAFWRRRHESDGNHDEED